MSCLEGIAGAHLQEQPVSHHTKPRPDILGKSGTCNISSFLYFYIFAGIA
jgi:hypothetical protein